MKIFTALKTATLRLNKSLRGILIVWLSSLILVSLVAIPTRAAINSILGKSMITEKLSGGLNVEVFAEMGATFTSLLSSFSTGFIISILAAFIINTFLTGGLFNSLKGSTGRFSASDFFTASAENFWSFLVISLILTIIILVMIILIIVLPVLLVSQTNEFAEGTFFLTITIVFPIFLMLLPIFLLVADYARAWLVSGKRKSCFNAISFGFSTTFRTFFSSYPLMLLLVIVQILYGWLVLTILSGMKPVTGTGVFLLFIVTQLLFLIKITLKVLRYGAVTSLMEQNF